MNKNLSVRTISENHYDQWSHFVAGCASGSLYALPEYLEILCEATSGNYSILGVYREDELIGGCPVYLTRTRYGIISAARPLLAYNGPVFTDHGTGHHQHSDQVASLLALSACLRKLDCVDLRLRIRHPVTDMRPFLAAGWQVRPAYTYLVRISDLDQAWQRTDRNFRRLVRRAAAAGLAQTDDDDFDSLYRMHAELHQRKGLPVYLGEKDFRRYFEKLRARNLCRLFNARMPNGEAIATQLVLLGPHPVSHNACAASADKYMTLGSNPFLRWKSMEALNALGYQANDLTGASLGNGVARFKSQIGGDLKINWAITRPLSFRYRLMNRYFRLLAKARFKWPYPPKFMTN
jgi:Acetyltransferase (GNAT) domain